MTKSNRQSTGFPFLDEALGGGLLPGTLTVVLGASGIGKTQLGVSYLFANSQEKQPDDAVRADGTLIDLATRIDSQNHDDYAERLVGRKLLGGDAQMLPDFGELFGGSLPSWNYLAPLAGQVRKVTRRDLNEDEWHEWKCLLQRRLQVTGARLYERLLAGCRRFVVDGVEPVEHVQDSVQFEVFEYLYRQILRQDPMWTAREVLREKFRTFERQAEERIYDPKDVGCMILVTSRESMLEDLIERPLEEGDLLANANTLIYMGKIREGMKVRRGVYVAKHRGSACSDDVHFYEIDDAGLKPA
ncbi:MAG TPA: recombinase RecA [Pirellulaceae bacterium]|nr:recombinase RecA [Pirellulaceae bacterium]